MPQTPRRVDKKRKRYERWGFIWTSCRVLVSVFFCSVMFPHFFVLHQPVIRRLSGGFVRHPRHHQTAERRRCAGPLQCHVIEDTIKLLNDDAALELFVCIIVALVAVVSCVRKTHIGCTSARYIEPEPAPEDPVDWAMAEASDDEDDAPMPDAPPEAELIDMPPAPASARPISNLERCIALRLVYTAGPR